MTKNTILNLKRYLQIRKDKEEISIIEPKVKKEVENICNNILTFLNYSKVFISKYCELFKNYCYINHNNYISFKNNLKAKDIDSENYKKIIYECIENLVSISKNIKEDEEDISKLCESYNTLILMLNVKNKLINNIIKVYTNDINKRIDANQKEIRKENNSQSYQLFEAIDKKDKELVKKLIIEDENSLYCEGNIVYGYKSVSISDEMNDFFMEYDIPLEFAREIVYLEAEEGKNAVYIRIDDMNEASSIIEKLLPNLFSEFVSTYKPNSFYLSFLENNNIKNMACAKFCNHIINTQNNDENNILIDSCLYKSTSKKDSTNYFSNGNASNIDEIKIMVSSIFDEFIRRKEMPQLSGKSLVRYNEENPYEILPYITLIINTFSDLFIEYNANDIFENLKTMVNDGGNYGIFVICVGKDTTIERKESNIKLNTFDLAKEFENVIEYKNKEIKLLCDEININDTLNKWEEKCKKFSSMQLEVLVKRKDIKIVDFYNEKGIITIPIGIANGKVSYFKTAGAGTPSAGVSSLITGKIGSGKTTFIRTLIMSGAYFYSPDQLQFFIIDFKTKEGTADFNCFCQGEIGYFPHVRFLSKQSGVQQAFSLLDYIDKITIERARLFTKYSEFNVQDAPKYRKVLYEKMMSEGCSTYSEYYHKIKHNIMPSLPQIYIIIDEANMVFKSDNIDLMENLEDIARKIRSYGISLIICGQDNPISSKTTILGHIDNRIALAAKEPLLFKKTFVSDNLEKELDRSFTFLGGQQGKAVFQLGSQMNLININTAFIKYNAISDFAKIINEKYNDEYYQKWVQNRPGTTEVASADELVYLLEDPNSVLNDAEMQNNNRNNNDVIKLYIGKNSLSSYPYPIVLNEKMRNSNEKQSNTDPLNYCIYGNLNTQLKILWNMIFYMAYSLKKEKLVISFPNLSINYVGVTQRDGFGRVIENKGEILMTKYAEIVRESGFNCFLNINRNTRDILEEFQKCYSIFQERIKNRNNDSHLPYLFCLANANEWLSFVEEVTYISDEKDIFNENNIIEFDPGFIDYFTKYCISKNLITKEDIDNLKSQGANAFSYFITFTIENQFNIENDKEIIDKYNLIINSENKINNIDKNINSHILIEQLKEMLVKGSKYAVYVIIGYSSANDYIQSHNFVDVKKWKNMITDSDTNENICYCKGMEIQLYDYLKSNKWIEFIKKLDSSN